MNENEQFPGTDSFLTTAPFLTEMSNNKKTLRKDPMSKLFYKLQKYSFVSIITVYGVFFFASLAIMIPFTGIFYTVENNKHQWFEISKCKQNESTANTRTIELFEQFDYDFYYLLFRNQSETLSGFYSIRMNVNVIGDITGIAHCSMLTKPFSHF